MKNYTLSFLFSAALILSCQTKKSEETEEAVESTKVEQRRQEVIAVHDEAMPLMSDIHQWKNKLAEQANDATRLNKDEKLLLRTTIQKLEDANGGMRKWMRDFSDVKTEALGEEEALKVLDEEMEKIKKVKSDMESSLKMAEAASVN